MMRMGPFISLEEKKMENEKDSQTENAKVQKQIFLKEIK